MRHILAMVAAAVLWSTGGLFLKIVQIEPLSKSALRSAVAALTLLAIAYARRIRIRPPKDRSSWLGVSVYALVMLLFVCANNLTTAANAIFLQYTAPIYVLILEPLFLKTRFRARDLGFVALAFVGMLLFFVGHLEAGDMSGNLLALGSGICLALLFLVARSQRENEEARWQAVTGGNILLCVAVGLYFLVSPASIELPATGAETGAIVFLGVVQLGIAYALFAYAISGISALEATLIGMLEPLLNPVWVFLGTGERPSEWALAGAGLIVASIAARAIVEQRKSWELRVRN
jgi:drug/metabolite transporter, DME family